MWQTAVWPFTPRPAFPAWGQGPTPSEAVSLAAKRTEPPADGEGQRLVLRFRDGGWTQGFRVSHSCASVSPYVTWDNESTYQEGLPGGSFASEDIPPRPGRGTGQPRLLERRVHRMLPGRGGESVALAQLPSGGPSSTPEGTVGLHMEPD